MKPSFNKNKFNKQDKTNKRKQQEEKFSKNNTKVQNPISNKRDIQEDSQIIRGYFINEKSYKELVIQRINTFLCGVVGFLVLFCFVCYYFVSCKEVQLNKISRETLELNYENEELQNKLDSLQSYYNIDRAVSKSNILDRAQQVVEVSAIDLPKVDLKVNGSKKSKRTMVINY